MLASRVTQMSAAGEHGQVAAALKGVLERVSAAAQRSGKDSKVLLNPYVWLCSNVAPKERQYIGAMSVHVGEGRSVELVEHAIHAIYVCCIN